MKLTTDKKMFAVIYILVNEVGIGKQNPHRALQTVSAIQKNMETAYFIS